MLHFLWQDLLTGIKVFVLVILTPLELAIIGGICVSKKHILFYDIYPFSLL